MKQKSDKHKKRFVMASAATLVALAMVVLGFMAGIRQLVPRSEPLSAAPPAPHQQDISSEPQGADETDKDTARVSRLPVGGVGSAEKAQLEAAGKAVPSEASHEDGAATTPSDVADKYADASVAELRSIEEELRDGLSQATIIRANDYYDQGIYEVVSNRLNAGNDVAADELAAYFMESNEVRRVVLPRDECEDLYEMQLELAWVSMRVNELTANPR